MGHTLRGCVDWNTGCLSIARRTRMSHPSWVCGLKHHPYSTHRMRCIVTPFVGVWIETPSSSEKMEMILRHTLRGCVDWNLREWSHGSLQGSHTLRGCVDWNSKSIRKVDTTSSHTLRGCVDWNILLTLVSHDLISHTLRGCVDWNKSGHERQFDGCNVTPFVGVWIETTWDEQQKKNFLVTPFVGVWIETLLLLGHALASCRHTLRGCVDWNKKIWNLIK